MFSTPIIIIIIDVVVIEADIMKLWLLFLTECFHLHHHCQLLVSCKEFVSCFIHSVGLLVGQ